VALVALLVKKTKLLLHYMPGKKKGTVPEGKKGHDFVSPNQLVLPEQLL
jgi:hypothetical protein